MRKIGYIILGVSLSLFSCNNSSNKKVVAENNDSFHLLGKKICSIDSIISENSSKIILLFNYYDCGSCVDSAFVIAKKIDSICGKQRVFIISTMGDPFYYQNRNNYYDYIYIDHKDLIRKELKYVQTPIIIKLDSMNMIINYILPNVTNYEESLLFIKHVIEN